MTSQSSLLRAAADAALDAAAARPWAELSLRAIAEAAGVSLADLYDAARSKDDVLDAVLAEFDRAAADDLDLDADAPERERVFDVAMARFDAMERRRAGAVSILGHELDRPLGALRLWPASTRTARWLLALAGVDTSGARGQARVQGFAVILARATRAWLRDDAGDLSKTMAALDRMLRDVDGWRARFSDAADRVRESAQARSASVGRPDGPKADSEPDPGREPEPGADPASHSGPEVGDR